MSSPGALPLPPAGARPAPITGPTPALAPGATRAQVHQAAQQFEALLVRQMLSAARADGLGDGLTGSSAIDNFRAMQDEQFAAIAAQRGSFGLGRMIETQVTRRLGPGLAGAAKG